MERRKAASGNWPVNGLNKHVTTSDNFGIKRSASKTEEKHNPLRHSVSLDQPERYSAVDSDTKPGQICKTRRHHASEKIGKSESSEYRNKDSSRWHQDHSCNVYRDFNERTELPFINAYDFPESHIDATEDAQKLKQNRKTSSVNDSLASSKNSARAKRNSVESKASKSVRQYCSDEQKGHKNLDRNSSASHETSSSELRSPKKKRSRSKRKEIPKTQATFYELPRTKLSLPRSSFDVSEKADGQKLPKPKQGLISSSFTVLEAEEGVGRRSASPPLQRRNCCLLSSLCTVCLILAGAVTTLLILFLSSSELPEDSQFDMIRAHVRLRIVNRNYKDSMGNLSDVSFTNIAYPFCEEVDYIFLTSSLHNEYFGCTTKQLRRGSVLLYYITPFLNSTRVKNVTNIQNIISGKESEKNQKDNEVYIGDFLIDVDSINIVLESYKSDKLPRRPMLKLTGSDSTSQTEGLKPTTLKSTFKASETSVVTSLKTTSFKTKSPDSDPSSVLTTSRASTTINKTSASTLPTTTTTISSSVTNPRSPLGSTWASFDETTSVPTETRTHNWFLNSTKDLEYFEDLFTTTEEIILPSIEMTSAEVHLNGRSSQLQCTVHGLKVYSGQISVYYRETIDMEPKVILTLINKGNIYSVIYQNTGENTLVSHKTEDYVVTIVLNFEEVDCRDVGYYTCELSSQGNQYSDTGHLKGFSMPDKPQLQTPSSFIEGEELQQPITCTSNTGYPPGDLRFEIKPRGHASFFPLQEENVVTSGICGNNKTISLTYTPTREANGTLLKCILENINVPHAYDLSSVVELKIIPANICSGYGVNKTVRHPFECNKYLVCRGKYFDIQECENGVCYDQESEKCGQTSLHMKDVVAYLNEGVASLKCHLTHTGSWNKIFISKANPGDGTKMQIVTVIRGQGPAILNTSMKDRLFANIELETRYELELNVWLYVLTCQDQGDYFCEVDGPFRLPESKGTIDIRVKPSAPSLSIPNELIEGLPTRYNFTCEADVGYPYGELHVKIKLHNETSFKPLWIQDEVTEEENNCSKIVRRTFQIIPSMDHNGMTIMCEVKNPATLPDGHSLVTSHAIHIVPGNFCKTHQESTPHVHPYDCHQYVQCSDDYIYVQRCGSDFCFDPETLRCDRPDPQNKPVFDPNYPCRPNQNGVFYHHPFLCNKYIWCVQGEEIVQHCPVGTLYIDNGHCTFDADQSRCYKTKENNHVAQEYDKNM